MSTLSVIFLIVHLVISIALMCIIAFQTGKDSGLGALSGKSDTFLSKNKQKSRDARLALATKWVAGLFVILTIVLNII